MSDIFPSKGDLETRFVSFGSRFTYPALSRWRSPMDELSEIGACERCGADIGEAEMAMSLNDLAARYPPPPMDGGGIDL
jgi:hypothetical protein